MSYDDHDIKIRNQIDMVVVLKYECDAKMIPAELNGGMAHREYLALQLAQKITSSWWMIHLRFCTRIWKSR